MKITVDTLIDRPQQQVWQAITDIEHCTDMITGIVDLNVLEKPDEGLIGLKWQETRQMFGKEATEIMWITEEQEPDHYKVRAESHGSVYLTTMSLSDEAGKTRLTMAFKAVPQSFFVKIMSAFFALFVKKSMIKMVQKDLDDIKKYLENR